MKIGDTFKELLNENDETYEYGCVMLSLGIKKSYWDKIIKPIDKSDIFELDGDRTYGIQKYNDTHITLLYGLHSDIPDSDIENIVKTLKKPKVVLDKIDIFSNEGSNFDVLKFNIANPSLSKINGLFTKLPHTTDFPKYEAHCTIAYLKYGTAKKYIRTLSGDDKIELEPNKIIYSKANGDEKIYTIK